MIHAWLGYTIAVIFLARLVASLTGLPALGLARFYPQFEGLKLGTTLTHPAISRTLLASMAACLIGATVTGIALDRGHSIALTGTPMAGQIVIEMAAIAKPSQASLRMDCGSVREAGNMLPRPDRVRERRYSWARTNSGMS